MFSTVRMNPEFTFSLAQQIVCPTDNFPSQGRVTQRLYTLHEYRCILYWKEGAQP